MWEIVQAGGPFMWPLILCSIGAAAIVLERLWTLQRKRVLPTELTDQVWKWLSANQVNDKLIAALEQNSPLGKVLAVGLANRHRPREIVIEQCRTRGVPYTETSLIQSYGIVIDYLNRVGLAARDPFDCPMVNRFRPA